MYNIGTVTTTANSPKITGTGTRWKDNTTLVSVGQIVLIENGSNLLINSIYSIESNTALTLAFPVSAKLTNAKYIILTTMIDSISDGVNKATAQVIASEVYTEILNQWMTAQGTIDVELPTGQKIKLRTVAEMDKQLDGKLDKAGGQITKNDQALAIKVAGESQANYIGFLDASGYRRGLVGYGNTTDDFAISNTRSGITFKLTADGKALIGSAEIIKSGDFGLGSISPVIDNTALTKTTTNTFFRQGGGAGNDAFTSHGAGAAIAYSTTIRCGYFVKLTSNELYTYTSRDDTNAGALKIAKVYSEANTTKDSNGNLKAASPIIRVFADHVDPNEEAEGVTLKKLHTGIYQLHGVLGLHSDASWGGINGGITIPCGINQLPLVYALYDVLEKGKQHPFDGRIVEPDEDGDIVLYTTYRKHDLPQNIQYERFKLYPEFLKEVDGEKVELTPGEPCDIPVGHWVDVRVNMPSNSIYNQKQAEAERLAKIEAERLAQEEAKRAAEEVERAE
ncbi:hypothetical protein [Providencia sp.]|uniref:phage tail fiber protein n=1 Tax=Providencia sp. TaxID=589 RepID=UPI00333FFAB2